MMKKNVKVYSTISCPYCVKVKDYLTKSNISFENIDVGADKDRAQEMINKSGQMGVPVIDIDGKIIIGLDKPKLDEELSLT